MPVKKTITIRDAHEESCSTFVLRTDVLADKLNIPLKDLHEVTGISTSLLWKCRGNFRNPSRKTWKKLEAAEAKAIGVPLPQPGPLMTAYSREELTGLMTDWMCKQAGDPDYLHEEAKERWFATAGRLFMFIRDHFPVENAETLRKKSSLPNNL